MDIQLRYYGVCLGVCSGASIMLGFIALSPKGVSLSHPILFGIFLLF